MMSHRAEIYLEHAAIHSSYNSGPALAGRTPALDTANPACLSARERRALLEDIGHVALVLGRSLRPEYTGSEPGGNVPASPVSARADALTSPLERLHYLCGLWKQLFGALDEIARQPDSRATNSQRQISLARSRGGAAAATRMARSPASSAAWQLLQATQSPPPRPVHSGSPSQVSMARIFPVSASPAIAAVKSPGVSSPNAAESAPNECAKERALIAEPVLASTHNIWANRMVVSLLKDMTQEAKALARLATFCDDEAAAVQAAQIETGAGRLLAGSFLRGCPALRPGEHDPPFAADLIARCAPAYDAAYRGWRALHHPLDFDWTHAPMLVLPSLEAWHLYEIWCCLQVGAALVRAGWHVEAASAQGPSAHALLRCTPQGLRLNMATGRASRLRFRETQSGGHSPKQQGRRGQDAETLDFYYQPLFSSANQTAFQQVSPQSPQQESSAPLPEPSQPAFQRTHHNDTARAASLSDAAPDTPAARTNDLTQSFESRSHAMQPDIALHWRGALTLLDPKYKRYAQPADAQDDINKMHTYRDAIVARIGRGHKTALRASGVQAAWCLFPGTGAEETLSKETLSKETLPEEALPKETRPDETQDAEPGSEPARTVYAYPAASAEHPFGTAGVGAFGLRPGQPDTLPRLAAFLTVLLNAE